MAGKVVSLYLFLETGTDMAAGDLFLTAAADKPI